jgi:tRNA(Ile)-lysidine synthase
VILIAYSGGIDSTVLLHQLALTHPREDLRAIHINHNLYPEADEWQKHCEQVCADLNISLITVKLQTKPSTGESIEAWARDQRLNIFKEHLQENEILMTAQHADDQAETVLLQLIRGSGPKGLSAMGAEKVFGRGRLVRPFLNTSKKEIQAYADQHQLKWITDHSNHDIQYDRNFLREKILPELKNRWPSVHETVSRSAGHCAQQEVLLETLLKPIYVACAGSQSGTLSIKALLQQEHLVQRALIRYWLDEKAFPMPGHKKFDKIFEDLIPARVDAQPVITWGEVCIRRYRDDLYALRLDEINPSKTGTKKSFQAEGIPPWERV